MNDDYNKSIREFINPVILTPAALRLIKFGTKYKSYANVLRNDNQNEQFLLSHNNSIN